MKHLDLNLLHCNSLYCAVIYCAVRYCIALHCVPLHCIALRCTTLHCVTQHCTFVCSRPFYPIVWFSISCRQLQTCFRQLEFVPVNFIFVSDYFGLTHSTKIFWLFPVYYDKIKVFFLDLRKKNIAVILQISIAHKEQLDVFGDSFRSEQTCKPLTSLHIHKTIRLSFAMVH